MRIAVGGIMHESNTFAAAVTDRRRFAEVSLHSGADLIRVWKDAHHEVGGFLTGAERFGFEAVPTFMAWATPGGPVADAMLDEAVEAILAGCRAGQVDGLLVALHGAMVTPSHSSGDGEILRRLRTGLGPKVPIVCSLDFHGNVSPLMADNADALIGYQTYPHIDQKEKGLLAAELIARTVRGEIKPVTAISKPALILNLLGQATDRPPMSTLLAEARTAEKQPGLLSISLMAGFPYADVPDMGPAVIAVADADRAQAQAMADEFGHKMYQARHDLYVACPPPAEAVARAAASTKKPVILVDLGDNVGGGSAADGTVLLAELLKQRLARSVVVLHAPEGVKAAQAAGVGGRFERALGGQFDRLHGDPVMVRGTVRGLHDGKWIETEARHGGLRHNDQGPTAVIDLDEGVTLVLNSLRTPPFSLGQITSVGIEPAKCGVIVVKAAVAYKAAYLPIAGSVIEVDTPGITAINPAHFTYRRIRRPMFPLDAD